MNITPIMEEKNFKLEEEDSEKHKCEQFSFDQEFNFAEKKEDIFDEGACFNMFIHN
jgi:hypothetical protein